MSYIEEVLSGQGLELDYHGKIFHDKTVYGYVTGKKVRFYDYDVTSPLYIVKYFSVEMKEDKTLSVCLYYSNGDIEEAIYHGRNFEAQKAIVEAAISG